MTTGCKMFLHGFFVASLIYLAGESSYEDALFEQIAQRATENAAPTDEAHFRAIVHASHNLMEERVDLLGLAPPSHVLGRVIRSGTHHLLHGKGACGSVAIVCTRLLQLHGIPARVLQLEAYGFDGGHIVLEAQVNGRWIVADPLFDLIFETPNGQPASVGQTHTHWASIKKTLPADYPAEYDYDEVLRTNWSKVPVLLPMIYRLTALTLGEETAKHISLRSWMLNQYKVTLILLAFLYLVILIVTRNRPSGQRIEAPPAPPPELAHLHPSPLVIPSLN